MLDKLVILKLNGGLGTRMGCRGPKSAIEVRNGLTFLDLTVRQVEYLNITYGVDVPLILMNSFNTAADTEAIIRKYRHHHIQIHAFNQSCYPRLFKESLMPVPTAPFHDSTGGQAGWYPPGHGDVYESLERCGLLENLIQSGKEYIFISNVDNLGATVDLRILFHVMSGGGDGGGSSDIEFCMEVTKRTRADVVGGTLVQCDAPSSSPSLRSAREPSPSSLVSGSSDNESGSSMSHGSAAAPRTNHINQESGLQNGESHRHHHHHSSVNSSLRLLEGTARSLDNMRRFQHFNTNNLWVKLRAIQRVVTNRTLCSHVIVHSLNVNGSPVIQLETAAVRFWSVCTCALLSFPFPFPPFSTITSYIYLSFSFSFSLSPFLFLSSLFLLPYPLGWCNSEFSWIYRNTSSPKTIPSHQDDQRSHAHPV